MAKVAVRTHAGMQYVWYHCPGCKHLHGVPTVKWNWNGDIEKPTLSPSVRHFIPAGKHGPERTVCHYHIREGRIEFCGDCEHDMNGKTIDLTEPNEDDVPPSS